jgi:hypothetical protein
LVDLDVLVRAAELARIGEEALLQVSAGIPHVRGRVIESRRQIPLERDTAPGRHERRFVRSFDCHP